MTSNTGARGSIQYSENNIEHVCLVAVRLDPECQLGNLYSLVLYYEVARKDRNRPLTHEGRIVLFRDPSDANRVLQMGGPAFRKYSPVSESVDALYDVSEVIRLITTEEYDPSAKVVDFLNQLFDFVEATGFGMPPDYQQILRDFADHLTFHRDYGAFFNADVTRRSRVVDAVLWSLGAILVRSKFT